MERPVIGTLILTVVLATAAVAQEQIPPPKPPDTASTPPPAVAGKTGEKEGPERGPHHRLFGPPFLMAADERFQKMIMLALAQPDQIQKKLAEWPEYKKMPEDQRAKMTAGVEGFRQRISRTAMEEAQKLGLTIPPDQEKAFIKAYWDKRIAAELPIRRDAEAKLKVAEEAMKAELKREYGAK